MLDFSFIKNAGISQAEASTVLGVSRVTVNTWINGKMHPHRLHEHRIRARLDALRTAVAAGKIPSAPKDARKKAIAAVAADLQD